ncbi:putative conjugal transfer trbj signal peptide protein precursor [Sphingobium herbicidovorans NBRC 16415]|uniref:Conjugal transfer trbj signal peptide protein n=2 Tax=Sphingobium herbicidovorans TaxID=76947 RepID=A0A086P5I2_SPHHM|nr:MULTISPECIES: P-type conjugative transfer protein TrbJ [Sphingomonadaceae]KFG88650.1 putative conjugal transfer trbj signal peptide protein precursor [Sphingobium herbicidovorans NBRC 16415]
MKTFAHMLLAAAAIPALLLAVPPATAMPVFDQANYSQNLLTAARTLKQIDQQIRQLQNEAQMLANMDKHLKRVDFPELEKLKDNLARVDALMEKAEGIDFGVDQLDARMAALFPKDFSGLPRSASVANAKARLDTAMASYRRTLAVQSRIAADVKADAAVLADVAARSSSAEGSLQAQQATNQLLALAAKQQMQLQQMMAAAYEADMIDRARAAQSAAEARERTRRFLGDGKAYTPIR